MVREHRDTGREISQVVLNPVPWGRATPAPSFLDERGIRNLEQKIPPFIRL